MIFKEVLEVVKIKGTPVNVNIKVEVVEDFCPLDYELDNDQFQALVIVSAEAFGIEGNDALGAVVLPHNGYDSRPFNNAVESTLTEYGMINEAISELKKNLIKRAKQLVKYA